MITVERGTILRGFFSLLTLHTWFSGLYEPRSLHYLVTAEAEGVGLAVISLFGCLGLMALMDTVVNDVMPKRYSLKGLLHRRHLIFMVIALLNAAELFVASQYLASWGLALYCILVCSFVVITAFRDVQLRFSGTLHA